MTNTPLRFYDRHDASHGYYFDATAVLAHVKSDWQDIKIIDTKQHGRVMLIEDVTMLTQSTHHVYHEHMAHVPLACIEAPRRVLVIGGGDGGVVSELVKYPALEAIELCELDGTVIDVSREWLPDVAAGLDDPRVTIRIGDGAAYLSDNPGAFDAIIIDSTDICEEAEDGVENASPLATDSFYADVKAGLKPGGIAMQILGSTVFYPTGMGQLLPRLDGLWTHFAPVQMPCPFYISGDWTAALMSETNALDPVHAHTINGTLRYFNLDVARGALALPNEVRALLGPA